MILALATALMVAIHVAGAYLGLRGSPIPREAGVPISLFEAVYWIAAYPYAPLLAAVFAPIHVAGAAAYLTGVLGRFATERRLRAYGVYEAVELAALLYLSYLTLRPPS
ncbi:MAG: hypothetical protein AT715_04805 [Thermoproteus sp. JCHS_4]|jgi:hypothetical protein|nr:MAG: hypothetical protein AT715_04805 [Thermoproteus sp. JCHS_4]